MAEHQLFVHRAELELESGDDPRAPGGAVTAALCGHWDHEPLCRWPHHNSEPGRAGHSSFRTVVVASAADEQEIRARIEQALRSGPWLVLASKADRPSSAELALGRRLASLPE
jgi:hypothetical protein